MKTEVAVSAAMYELALGESFTFDALVEAIEQRRGHRVRIIELDALGEQAGLCALLMETDDQDLVFHAPTESALHRQQFVLHEFAHLILGHVDGDDPAAPDFLLPDIPRSTRRRLLRRQDLDTPREILAESMADHLAAAIRASAVRDSRFLEIFG
ncbi:hypothetical protein J7E25_05525 [Agromyces sp. ISL-38]|uniref:hypothetical protein n=1 Tax=Agromyces sp. ISL-38 TaxID=2819107 RepID=UPI001BE7F031|nr:hypothetical protein [Agromyces sp. ISL-38]MBT2498549.1 hypothetical protein [Agromyces sp. ISL-38]